MSGTASTVCHTTIKTNRNKNTRGYRAEQANPGKEMCMNHQNNFLSLPETIRENCRFCCWRKEHRNGTDTKVPYTPTSGNRAKSNDVKTFCSFEQALTAYNNSQNTKHPYSGLGICVDGNIGAIDIDHCLDADGNLNDVATAVLGAFKDCYFEVSPSGTGLRGFFRLSQDFEYDTAVYYTKNSRYGLEIYLPGYTSRFVTVTGNTYREGNVSSDMDALQLILDTFMLRAVSSDSVDTSNTDRPQMPHSFLSDEQVLAKAYASANGALFKDLYEGNWQEHADKYPSQSEADMAFAAMLAFWCGCDFEQMNRIFESSGLYREKWDRAQSGSTYGAITLANAIKRCTETYCPFTSAADEFAVLDEDEAGEDAVEASKRQDQIDTILSSEITIDAALSPQLLSLAAWAYLHDKTYTVSILDKKRSTNNGQRPKYYVEGSHEAIIDKDVFMRVQSEIARRANLNPDGKRRVYNSKYALSGMVFCGHCGDIYRRVKWNNRGCKSTVWRCVSRVLKKDVDFDCPARMVREEVLQGAIVTAVNDAYARKNIVTAGLKQNIESTVFGDLEERLAMADKELADLQAQMIAVSGDEAAIDALGEQIDGLRAECQSILAEAADRGDLQECMNDMIRFLDKMPQAITEYSDTITRRLVEKITIYDKKIVVELKSGLQMEVEA